MGPCWPESVESHAPPSLERFLLEGRCAHTGTSHTLLLVCSTPRGASFPGYSQHVACAFSVTSTFG